MLLLFVPNPPDLQVSIVRKNKFNEVTIPFSPDWVEKLAEHITDLRQIDAIGYLLYHGGETIQKPVTKLSTASLTKLESLIKFLPEYNEMTYKTAGYWFKKLPKIPHLLFCDTAFFAELPLKASTYAVPYRLRKTEHIQRFGGYGLAHHWAWQQIQSIGSTPIQKVISIYLGNNSNVTAIKAGKAVDTSVGFTPVEGIISTTGCGDIDPTIIFYLYSGGMSFNEINTLLSQESGLTALVGKKTNFLDFIHNESATFREIFRYSIIKYLGAYISILGGIDAIVFLSEDIHESRGFILEICQVLEFMGIQFLKQPTRNKTFWKFTNQNSLITVFGLQYNKWEVLATQSKTSLS